MCYTQNSDVCVIVCQSMNMWKAATCKHKLKHANLQCFPLLTQTDINNSQLLASLLRKSLVLSCARLKWWVYAPIVSLWMYKAIPSLC